VNLGDFLRDELEASEFKHLTDLTVLIADNDPFRQDAPRKLAPGRWLAAQVNAARAAGRQKLHMRGWHYALLGVPDWTGVPYINAYDKWNELGTKGFDGARWNGLLPFDEIIDQRNLPPVLRINTQVTPEPRILIPDAGLWLPDSLRPEPALSALDDHEVCAQQEHRLAIIGEKSSLLPVLGPLADEYGADLYLPTGEASETGIYALAKAAAEDGRRLVVFYIADFDPAGWQMPISVARKLQAHIIRELPDMEVEFHRVGLTVEQVEHYHAIGDPLPESPIKPSEKRADKWRDRWGYDQTEIDALATLRPDDLREIVIDALDAYYDHTLDERVEDARREWAEQAREAIEEQIGAGVLDRIEREARDKLDAIQQSIGEVNELLDIDVSGVELPPFEPPECHNGTGLRDPLFDSDDDFVDATRRLIEDKEYGS
jgi:hypothetical protein